MYGHAAAIPTVNAPADATAPKPTAIATTEAQMAFLRNVTGLMCFVYVRQHRVRVHVQPQRRRAHEAEQPGVHRVRPLEHPLHRRRRDALRHQRAVGVVELGVDAARVVEVVVDDARVVVTITVSRMLSATCAATGGARRRHAALDAVRAEEHEPIDDGMLCGRAIASSPHLSGRPIEHSSSASLSVQRSGRVAHGVSSSAPGRSPCRGCSRAERSGAISGGAVCAAAIRCVAAPSFASRGSGGAARPRGASSWGEMHRRLLPTPFTQNTLREGTPRCPRRRRSSSAAACHAPVGASERAPARAASVRRCSRRRRRSSACADCRKCR